MVATTIGGADGRTWVIRREIERDVPATGDEFEHDVDGGRGAAILILSGLGLFWLALLSWWGTKVHLPWYLAIPVAIVVLFLFVRWRSKRPWTLVAETTGNDLDGPERWVGMVRGRARARDEVRILVRNLQTRATPGYADSPLRPMQ